MDTGTIYWVLAMVGVFAAGGYLGMDKLVKKKPCLTDFFLGTTLLPSVFLTYEVLEFPWWGLLISFIVYSTIFRFIENLEK